MRVRPICNIQDTGGNLQCILGRAMLVLSRAGFRDRAQELKRRADIENKPASDVMKIIENYVIIKEGPV